MYISEIQACENTSSLLELEKKLFGKTGDFTLKLKGLKDLSLEEKQLQGKALHAEKLELEAAIKARRQNLEDLAIEEALQADWIDWTLPSKDADHGTRHPLFETQEEVEAIFTSMGFQIIDGPEIESEWYNFEGLNIPAHHPARDMQDTFFMQGEADEKEGRLVLRTHTSPNQVRAMQNYGAPLRIIIPGRVFRNEATDATHEHTFDQVEGLLIDKNINLAHLKGIMTTFLSRLFNKEMKVRFRPGYFPFVEPGIELDMSCVFCSGEGCRVCKKSGWIEFMGCGMVHPKVLEAGGLDPKEYQGWAFGFGLTRLVMMRYGIHDIRHLTNGDIRIHNHFL